MRNLADLEERQHYCFVCGDIADANFVAEVMAEAQIDPVVHFAPESHGDRSISDPQSLVRTNIPGTQVLLEAARRYAIDSGKSDRGSGGICHTGSNTALCKPFSGT
ncbi:NAD-dependent epimerase/dehydratase family protein [Paenibacillus elgii]|nr:NAD-dependent epimerase/dehydratase family protein [Paenibacillus elgii]